MSNDEADEADCLIQFDGQFHPGYVGNVISQQFRSAQAQIAGDTAAINRLIPYITNMMCEDRQRQYAERELFRLQVSIDEAYGDLQNCLSMLADVGRPALIKT